MNISQFMNGEEIAYLVKCYKAIENRWPMKILDFAQMWIFYSYVS